jgi:hypothetical protein
VLLKDDSTKKAREEGDYDDLSLRRHLSELLTLAQMEGRSLIIDMKANGKRIIQVDEASRNVLELLEPFSFMQVETSAGNYQAWLALPEQTPRELCGAVTSRLFARLKTMGANRGASGGLRWPGSINEKPGRNGFRVRLERAALGRIASPEALETAGLLAPLPEAPEQPQPARQVQSNTSRVFPDYRRCLSSKGGDRSRADASFLKIALLRGFTSAEAAAELARVSDRVQQDQKRGRRDYVPRTVAFVEA